MDCLESELLEIEVSGGLLHQRGNRPCLARGLAAAGLWQCQRPQYECRALCDLTLRVQSKWCSVLVIGYVCACVRVCARLRVRRVDISRFRKNFFDIPMPTFGVIRAPNHWKHQTRTTHNTHNNTQHTTTHNNTQQHTTTHNNPQPHTTTHNNTCVLCFCMCVCWDK